MKKRFMSLSVITIALMSCDDDYEGYMNLNVRNETGESQIVKLFTVKRAYEPDSLIVIDSTVFDMEIDEELVFKYTPNHRQAAYTWMFITKTDTVFWGYFPRTFEEDYNDFYFKLSGDSILISNRSEGFW